MDRNRAMAEEAGRRASGGGDWIKGAVRHPGALRALAKRRGLLKGGGNLSEHALSALAASGDEHTRRMVALARTFRGFKH